jgi:hypothetical protein
MYEDSMSQGPAKKKILPNEFQRNPYIKGKDQTQIRQIYELNAKHQGRMRKSQEPQSAPQDLYQSNGPKSRTPRLREVKEFVNRSNPITIGHTKRGTNI